MITAFNIYAVGRYDCWRIERSSGSVDSKQLETLMCRGLTEGDATDLIIDGLLSPNRQQASGG